jgi:MscS family membrane protein
LPDQAQYPLYGVLKTLAILVCSTAALRIVGVLLRAFSRRASAKSVIQPRTVPMFDMLVKILVFGLAIYFMFLAWHIDVTAWLASAGIIGIAIGFAARDSLANFFAGIFIIADAPYKMGDFIVINEGLRGRVTRIGMRSTRILTRDDVEINVPNALIGNSTILNEVGGPYAKQRTKVTVAAAYDSDVDRVSEVLLSCVDGFEHVCAHPKPEVRFREFGDSGLIFDLLFWVDDPATRNRTVAQMNMRVFKAFHAAGIEIPYSKHDVYIKEMPSSARLEAPLSYRSATR